MLNILLIDDHPLVADGIKAMLATQSELQIAAVAQTAAQALLLLDQTAFDLVLLDISLPDTDGLTLCATIRLKYPSIKIIGLSSTDETGIITQFLQRGGQAYLLKNMERHELFEAIEHVQQGKLYLSRSANAKILEQYRNVEVATQHTPVLTRREAEILQLLNEGLSGPQIAKQLFISPLTVETHRKNLMQKLGANTAQMLLKRARDLRLLH